MTSKLRFLNLKKSKGFSLVELSVSLAIIGMIATSALSVAITDDYEIKKRETTLKMIKIDEAIIGFATFNKRLPCPADGSDLLTDADFGIAETPVFDATNPTTCPNANDTTGGVDKGVVPVRTLQLPNDFMFDGWGRRISYAVDRNAVHNNNTLGDCDDLTSPHTECFIRMGNTGTIVVNDESGNLITNPVYILVSHGENGHGAYPKLGGTTRLNGFQGTNNPYRDATASADEYENANMDISNNDTYNTDYVSRSFMKVDDESLAANARTYFDDIVKFKTRNQIIRNTGALIFNDNCIIARNIVESSTINNCTDAASENECENFAVEIYSRCLL